MEYKLIKKFLSGLVRTPIHGDVRDFVLMSDLEAELAKGVELFTHEKDTYGLYSAEVDGSTHSGLLIGYQPLESSKPVSREEIENFINNSSNTFQRHEYTNFLKRILENGVK